jgi:cell wall-associated NlpC family hydrolase
MEFSFFVGLDVHQGAGDDTGDLTLADVDADKFDETLGLGDLVLLMVSNPKSGKSVAGHSLIYAGNDHFISPMLDGDIYFQNIRQVKNIWEQEPGEGVLGVKFALKKVVEASIITEKSSGLRRLHGHKLVLRFTAFVLFSGSVKCSC